MGRFVREEDVRTLRAQHKHDVIQLKRLIQTLRDEIYVGRTKNKGRGVFAGSDLKKGHVLTMDPVLIFKNGEAKGTIHKYTFEWDDDTSAIALGLGSLMNHACPANVEYRHKFTEKQIWFIAYRDIKKGEELCINYNCDPEDDTPPKGFKMRR